MFKDILTKNWKNYIIDEFPIDRRMKVIDDNKIIGMNSENVRFLINELVKQYADNGVYFEIGSYQGASLISAAYQNNALCIGIDNFSEFTKDNTEKTTRFNIKKMELKNAKFLNTDGEFILEALGEIQIKRKVDVYFYDANHDYAFQYRGLINALPILNDKCIIIIDDTNWWWVNDANNKFLKKYPEFKVLIDIKTEKNGHKTWWNGITILGRGIE